MNFGRHHLSNVWITPLYVLLPLVFVNAFCKKNYDHLCTSGSFIARAPGLELVRQCGLRSCDLKRGGRDREVSFQSFTCPNCRVVWALVFPSCTISIMCNLADRPKSIHHNFAQFPKQELCFFHNSILRIITCLQLPKRVVASAPARAQF